MTATTTLTTSTTTLTNVNNDVNNVNNVNDDDDNDDEAKVLSRIILMIRFASASIILARSAASTAKPAPSARSHPKVKMTTEQKKPKPIISGDAFRRNRWRPRTKKSWPKFFESKTNGDFFAAWKFCIRLHTPNFLSFVSFLRACLYYDGEMLEDFVRWWHRKPG